MPAGLLVLPLLLGIKWMDPEWLLKNFHTEFLWISLAIVFVECGLLFPVLPGDTLLFAMGIFIATGEFSIVSGPHLLDLVAALVLFTAAAFLGNLSGYEIGSAVGPPLRNRDGRIIRKKHLDRTHEFFDKHGNKALVIGRFVPFVRTYVTVVAGIGGMSRRRFLLWSGVGAVAWVCSIVLLGYFLGRTVPWLQHNIDYAVLVILAFSAIPIGWEWRKHHREAVASKAASD